MPKNIWKPCSFLVFSFNNFKNSLIKSTKNIKYNLTSTKTIKYYSMFAS